MHEPPIDAELRELLCLTMVQGVGPATCKSLLEHFGSASKVLRASMSSLRNVKDVGPVLAERIVAARQEHDPDVELTHCKQHGVSIVPYAHSDYPPPLKEIHDPPSLLYRRGTYLAVDQVAIAIVGSRRCTHYGTRVAEKLAASLACVGITVVSGLARGIDAAAHRGALRAGGRTLAVQANGLAKTFPPEHTELADQIAHSGAVLSEMAMGIEPLPGFFPQRNRIVSGLCKGVVVVEATPNSGSLITARHATEQNREVFAVPGPINNETSRGCHALIRDGAKLVECVEDIIEELGPLVGDARPVLDDPAIRRVAELDLNDQQRLILGFLDDDPKPVDHVVGLTNLTVSQVMATLSVLEMRRLVKRMPGNQYVRF